MSGEWRNRGVARESTIHNRRFGCSIIKSTARRTLFLDISMSSFHRVALGNNFTKHNHLSSHSPIYSIAYISKHSIKFPSLMNFISFLLPVTNIQNSIAYARFQWLQNRILLIFRWRYVADLGSCLKRRFEEEFDLSLISTLGCPSQGRFIL
jgi:hypothetical protein